MSATVYRIVWAPGSDRLHGTCHCGAEHAAEDPVELWQWLLAHPEHAASEPDGPAPRPTTPPPPLTGLEASRPTAPPPPLTGLEA